MGLFGRYSFWQSKRSQNRDEGRITTQRYYVLSLCLHAHLCNNSILLFPIHTSYGLRPAVFFSRENFTERSCQKNWPRIRLLRCNCRRKTIVLCCRCPVNHSFVFPIHLFRSSTPASRLPQRTPWRFAQLNSTFMLPTVRSPSTATFRCYGSS